MIRKTVLMAGVAAALFTAAPALAQDATAPTAPQTPPAAQAQAQGSLQLQPGSSVKGSDGAVLGTLEGVQTNAAGEQELTVRGSDGALRGVPLGGLTQQGADVMVGWTATEFGAAPAVEDAAPAPGAAPSASEPMAEPSPTTAPTDAGADDAAEPDGATPPTPQG